MFSMVNKLAGSDFVTPRISDILRCIKELRHCENKYSKIKIELLTIQNKAYLPTGWTKLLFMLVDSYLEVPKLSSCVAPLPLLVRGVL